LLIVGFLCVLGFAGGFHLQVWHKSGGQMAVLFPKIEFHVLRMVSNKEYINMKIVDMKTLPP
jgi:hypothetical protein